LKSLILYFKQWIQIIDWFFQALLQTDVQRTTEIVDLRSQIAIMQQNIETNKTNKPKFTTTYSQL